MPLLLRHHSLNLRDTGNFLGRGDAVEHFDTAIFQQRFHAIGDGHFADHRGTRAFVGQFPHFRGHHHHLKNADASAITGIVAGVTSDAAENFLSTEVFVVHAQQGHEFAIRIGVRLFALFTEGTNEPLRHDRLNGGRHEEGFDTHVN